MYMNVRDMELRPLRISTELPIGEIDFFDPKLQQSSPLKVEGQAALRQVLDEIRLTGRFTVEFEIECDRCLEPYRLPIAADFDLVYMPETTGALPEEAGLNDEETELAFYKGSGLELNDVLREQILLAVPMRKTCREDCEGLCPTCGENWNLRDCACQPVDAIDRWAGLRDFKLKN